MDKIVVDRERCGGLGVCESLAGAYFETDDEGELVLLRDEVEPHDRDAVEEAVASCPTEALRVHRV
ncbi:ferredoxin [Nocardioides endophyticus]|uniref:Ferredoxin n=1 Tax=Nocardioides endophyticus TaxID=1353775 RepID=A0ABP8YA84_9ACTN